MHFSGLFQYFHRRWWRSDSLVFSAFSFERCCGRQSSTPDHFWVFSVSICSNSKLFPLSPLVFKFLFLSSPHCLSFLYPSTLSTFVTTAFPTLACQRHPSSSCLRQSPPSIFNVCVYNFRTNHLALETQLCLFTRKG